MQTLPTLADLHHDVQGAFKNDQLNLILNQPPHASWIKKHPMTKGDYIPIDKIEFLLKRIFGEYRIEVISFSGLFNSIAVHVRLHYKHPITGEWNYHDGVGAAPVQTDAGKSASDLAAIKNGAIQMALPAAESYAIKDAAEKFGTLFGSDLNRKDTILFSGSYSEPPAQPQQPTAAPKQKTMMELHQDNSRYVAPIQTPTPAAKQVSHTFNFSDL